MSNWANIPPHIREIEKRCERAITIRESSQQTVKRLAGNAARVDEYKAAARDLKRARDNVRNSKRALVKAKGLRSNSEDVR